MPPQKGDTVRVHYTGTLDDGEVFDSSREGDPLEFKIGEGQIIPGFEAAVKQMNVGESRTITLPCQEAYGDFDPEMIQELERGMFPDDADIEPGIQFQAEHPDGGLVLLTVLEANDEMVKVDGNHPLAGKNLTFSLELTEIIQ